MDHQFTETDLLATIGAKVLVNERQEAILNQQAARIRELESLLLASAEQQTDNAPEARAVTAPEGTPDGV